MPIIAGRASAAYGAGFAAITAPPYLGPFGAFDSIATTTVGAGGASSVTFSSIPSTYQHLQVRYLVRNSTDAFFLKMQFNGDTGSNYSWQLLSGDGDSATASATASTTDMVLPRTSSPSLVSTFTVGVVDILDYANTSKYKTSRALGGFNENSTDGGLQKIELSSGNWRNTNAVSSIALFVSSGGFTQYSEFALYGIKGGN